MFLATHGVLRSLSGFVPPVFNNSYSIGLDGISDYVTSNSNYTELDGVNKASFSMWLKPITGGSTLRTVFQIGDGSSSGVNGVCQLFLFKNNRIDFSIDSGSFFGRADISSINYDNWNHIMITVDLTQTNPFRCYVNGVDETTGDNMGSKTSFPNATEPLYIGEFATGQYTPFLGNIDEFAIWSGFALSSTNVSSIYNNGAPTNLNFTSGVSSPTTYYRFGDGDASPDILDHGSSSNDATMQSFSTFSTDVP